MSFQTDVECGIMNLAPENNQLVKSLRLFTNEHPERLQVHATMLDQHDKDLENLGVKARNTFNSSIVIATLNDAITTSWSSKIGFVTDKMKKGFLLILQLNTTAPNNEQFTFLLKTILLRGIFNFSS
jgi:hypothetical protein